MGKRGPKPKPPPEPSLPVPVESMRQAHRALADYEQSKKPYRNYTTFAGGKRLTDWEYKLAEWWARYVALSKKKQPQVPTVELATRARMFQTECKDKEWPADRVFTKSDWKALKVRKEFNDYFHLLLQSMQDAAKKKFEDHSIDFVDAHMKGLALATENNDYKQIYRYTNPAIDRIVPVKQTQQIAAVQIILSPAQQQTLDAPLPVVEAEIID